MNSEERKGRWESWRGCVKCETRLSKEESHNDTAVCPYCGHRAADAWYIVKTKPLKRFVLDEQQAPDEPRRSLFQRLCRWTQVPALTSIGEPQ